MPYHRFHTYGTSPHCGWADAFLDFQVEWMLYHMFHTCGTSPNCGWAYVFSDVQLDWMPSHIFYTYVTSPHCGWAYAFLGPFWTRRPCHISDRHWNCWLLSCPPCLTSLVEIWSTTELFQMKGQKCFPFSPFPLFPFHFLVIFQWFRCLIKSCES